MSMMPKDLFRFVILPLLVIGFISSQALAVFNDPLELAAKRQSKPLSQPFISSAVSGNNLVVVGPRGLVLFSRDHGLNWDQAEVPVQSDLVSVFFVNESRGWVVGHDGVILVSDDGGASWSRQLDGMMAGEQFVNYYQQLYKLDKGDSRLEMALELTELNYRDGPALPYLDVWFKNEMEGFVVGAFGNIARTEDGGESWTPWVHRIDNEAGFHLTSIESVGEDIFIGSERGVLFKLNEERQFFEQIETDYTGTFTGITGREGLVVAYGLQGTAFISRDEGHSWIAVEGLTSSTINHATMRPGVDGYAFVSQSGDLIFSDMHLDSFERVGLDESSQFTSIVSLSERMFLITTLDGLVLFSAEDKTLNKVRGRE